MLFRFFLPGRYKVEVSHSGFKKYERPNVGLGTSEEVPLNIQLELGNVRKRSQWKPPRRCSNPPPATSAQTVECQDRRRHAA